MPRQFAAALRPFAEAITPTYQTPPVDEVGPQATAVTTVVRTPRHAGRRSRRPLGWLLAGLAIAAGLAAIAVTLLDGRNDPEVSASASSIAITAESTAESTSTTAIASAATPTTARPATANTTPSSGSPASAAQGVHSVIVGLLATDSIDKRLADHVDRDAQKALQHWERGDVERAEKELRGVLDELDRTKDDMDESAIGELHDRIAEWREQWASTSSARTMIMARTSEVWQNRCGLSPN